MSLVAFSYLLLPLLLFNKSHHLPAFDPLDFLLVFLDPTPVHDFLIKFSTVGLLLLLFPSAVVVQVADPGRTQRLL